MLKTISTRRARIGIFVHKFCGPWMHHPFWSRQLLIEDQANLDKLLASSVLEIIIDTERGIDVEDAVSLELQSEPVADPLPEPAQPIPSQSSEQMHDLRPCRMQDEVERARQIIGKAKRAVLDMFADARMGKALQTEGLMELIGDMSSSLHRNSHALISVARVKHKDEYTYMHSVAVAALMLGLARQYGCDEDTVRLAGMAGLMHDTGKALMPEEILNKPGKLTDDEFTVMRSHPEKGHALLMQIGHIPTEVLDVCLHHHEKVDGTGYPAKLAVDRISLLSRMGAICDVYDAITSNRPYKSGWDPAESLSRMASWQGHFDPVLFKLFVRMLGIYPVGSLVRLKSERLAVVIEQGQQSLLTPRLSVFYSIRLRQKVPLEQIDLAAKGVVDAIVSRESPEDWGFSGLEKLWLEAGG